jgi:hypothetical protein
MEGHIHYRHNQGEIVELQQAIIPMSDYVRAVSTDDERNKLNRLLDGRYFRVREAKQACAMLVRSCKYSRATLGNYFDLMHPQILLNAQLLENAVNRYWKMFQELRDETLPVN